MGSVLPSFSVFCFFVSLHLSVRASQAPEHVGEGFTQGLKYFGQTLKLGVTGVLSKPYQGAKKDGTIGFVKGMGKGIVGLVAAPVSGIRLPLCPSFNLMNTWHDLFLC